MDRRSDQKPDREGGGMVEPEELTEGSLQAPLARRLLAEFVGTLVFVAVGAGVATVATLGPVSALGGLNEVLGGQAQQELLFGTLLGNSFADTLAISLGFAFALSTLVYALGGVSGAHFNPAVTFGLAVARRFSWSETIPYVIVQCLGAIAGVFVIAGIYGRGDPGGADVLFGATVIADGVNQAQALLAEAFITFILMTAVMAVAVDPRAPKGFSGIGIGLALAAGILVTAAATGGSANFARSLGPFVVSLFYDTPKIPWDDLIIYAAGPLIGAAAAALVYESVTGLEAVSPAPAPGAATGTEAEHDHEATESHVHSHGAEMHSHPHDHSEGPGHDHEH
jgi:glycerol uptake facilitator protein